MGPARPWRASPILQDQKDYELRKGDEILTIFNRFSAIGRLTSGEKMPGSLKSRTAS